MGEYNPSTRFLFACVLLASLVVVGVSAEIVGAQDNDKQSPEEYAVWTESGWHQFPDTQIFHAGRENTGDNQYEGDYYQSLEHIRGKTREDVSSIQGQYDFFYESTFPVMKYDGKGNSGVGSDDGTHYALANIHGEVFQKWNDTAVGNNQYSSRTSLSPPPEDGDYIHDAHVTIDGVLGSAMLHTDAAPSKRIFPKQSLVLQYGDFRLNLPEDDCQITGDRQVCQEYELVDRGFKDQTLSMIGQSDVAEFDISDGWNAEVSYCCPDIYGQVVLKVESTAYVEIKETETEYEKNDDGRWEILQQSQQTIDEEIQVRDSLQGYRLGQITLRQEVFEYPSKDRKQIRFQIQDGNGNPAGSLSEDFAAYLWQSLEFSHGGSLNNVWGVYSVAQEYPRFNHTKDGVETLDDEGPVYPRLAITPQHKQIRQSEAYARLVVGDAVTTSETAVSFSDRSISLSVPDGSQTYSEFYLRDAPSEIVGGTTIAGGDVTIDTQHYQLEQPELTGTELENGNVEFKLTGPNGEPLAGEPLTIEGGLRDSVTVDENGTVKISPEGEFITATYNGFAISQEEDNGLGTVEINGDTRWFVDAETRVELSDSSPLNIFSGILAQLNFLIFQMVFYLGVILLFVMAVRRAG